MPNVGSAYVTLMPSMKGFAAGVNKGISGIDTSSSGKAIGAKTAKGFAGGFASGGIVIGAAAAVANKAMDAISGSMSRAISRVDTMRNFPKVMVNLGYSAEDAARNIQSMSDGLDGLPTSLDAMVSMVQQLTPLSSSMDEATQIGLAFNNMLLAGGADMQQQQSALLQYTQALAKGKPELQDWRTLQQVMPGQLDQTAKALLGASAKSMDLYDALKSGKVSMSDFNQAILRLNTEGANGFASFEQQARDATTGIQTAMDNMATRTAKGVATMIDAIGQENISGAINYLSGGIGGIANSLAGDLSAATEFVKGFSGEIKSLADFMTNLAPAAIRVAGVIAMFKVGKSAFSGYMGTIGNLTGRVNALGQSILKQSIQWSVAGKAGTKAMTGIGRAMAGMSTGPMIGITATLALLTTAGGMLADAIGKAQERSKNFTTATQGMGSAVQGIIGSIDAASGKVNELGANTQRAALDMDAFLEKQASHAQSITGIRDSLNEELVSLNSAQSAIQQYAGKTDLTTQEQGKLQAAIGIVNDKCGTQFKVIDAANGAISDSKGNYDKAKAAAGEYVTEIGNVIAAKREEARANAMQQSLETAYKAEIDAQAAYGDAVNDMNKARADLQAAQDMGLSGDAIQGYADAYMLAAQNVRDTKSALDEASNSVDVITGNMGAAANAANGVNAAFVQFASDSGFETFLSKAGYSIDDFSKQMSEAGISVEALQLLSSEQLATLANSYQGNSASIVTTLASMGAAVDAYNTKQLLNKGASIHLEDNQLVDALGNIYTYNGTDLIDQNGNVAVDGTQLIDANGQIKVWNQSKLKPQTGKVTVDTGAIDRAKQMWEDWNPQQKTLHAVVSQSVKTALGIAKDARGGFVKAHALGGFLTNGVTGLGMDRDGNYHVAGEDGIEWIKYHADGTTSIVPIENRKYLEPYASVIASMIPNRGGTTVNETNIHMDYRAGEDAKTIVRDMARRIRRQSLMRG